MKNIILIIYISLALASCGRKSDPEAPEAFAPKAVSAVDIKCEGNSIILSWAMPANSKGSSLPVVKDFYVRRRAIVNNQEGGLNTLEVIPVGNKVSSSQRFQYEDKDVKRGTSYKYYIYGVDEDDVAGDLDAIYKVNYLKTTCLVEPLPGNK